MTEQWTDNFDFLCSRCKEFVTPLQGFECPECHYTLIARRERSGSRLVRTLRYTVEILKDGRWVQCAQKTIRESKFEWKPLTEDEILKKIGQAQGLIEEDD